MTRTMQIRRKACLSTSDIKHIVALAEQHGVSDFAFTLDPIFTCEWTTYSVNEIEQLLRKSSGHLDNHPDHDYGLKFESMNVMIIRHDESLSLEATKLSPFVEELQRVFT